MSMKKGSKELIDDTADDSSVSLTLEDIRIQTEFTELKLKKEGLEGIKQDREERKNYATKIFYFLSAFVALMLSIVILCGFRILPA